MAYSVYDEEKWTPQQFIEKYEWEGGTLEMLEWGGPGCFPPELRAEAAGIEHLNSYINTWLEEHGY
jgi:hypothetical protein